MSSSHFLVVKCAARKYSTLGLAYFIAALQSGGALLQFAIFSFAYKVSPSPFWHFVPLAFAAASLLAIPFILKHRDNTDYQISPQTRLKHYKKALLEPHLWFCGLLIALIYLPISTIANFWGTSLLISLYGLGINHATVIAHLIILGFAIGAPLQVCVAKKLQSFILPILYSAVVSLCLLTIVLYIPNLPLVLLSTSFIFLGGTLSSLILAIIHVASRFEFQPCLGMRLALLKMIKFTVSLIIIKMVAKMLNGHWEGITIHNQVIYSHFNYAFALAIVPICMAVAIILSQVIYSLKP